MERLRLSERIELEIGRPTLSHGDDSKMEVVKAFNNELVSLYDIKPPISKAKMTAITKAAMKSVKFYKHVVHGVEKFILKCRPDYKIPGLYVIDSIVRQSRHQFGIEKDVFAPRFSKNLLQTFKNICLCPEDDKQKLVRVINLWQKHKVFPEELLQKFLVMAEASEDELPELYRDEIESIHKSSKKSPTSSKKKKKSPVRLSTDLISSSISVPNHAPSSSFTNTLTANSNSRPSNYDGANKSTVDSSLIQQLQTLTTLLQQSNPPPNTNVSPAAASTPASDQVKFDKKLLDYDYGEEEEESGTSLTTPAPAASTSDSITSILTNPDILRQLQAIQAQLAASQAPGKPAVEQQASVAFQEQHRLLQMQQMHAFNQAMMQPPPSFGQDCNINFFNPAISSVAQENEVSAVDDDADDKPEIIMEKHGSDPLEVIDLDHIATPPSEKSPRQSYSRSRSRSSSRSRSRSRRHRNRRSRSTSWDCDRGRDRDKNDDRRRRALPPIKRKHLAVCSTTLWVGHLSKLVQEQDLSDTFGEFGDIVSIDLIPPRGCAFLCMNRRQDADRALRKLKNTKIQGKAITIAWAPGKGMKGREWKDYWEGDYGVSYIPWSKLTKDTDYDLLEEGGMLDQETMPEWLKTFLEEKRNVSYSKSSKVLYTPSGTDMDESSNDGDENNPSNNDMVIESVNGGPEQLIPLPDGPQPSPDMPPIGIPLPPGQNTPMSQAGPMNLPPPNLLNPFGLPPRLLTPMGMLGGNFIPPLGVPPPVPGLLMSPQHMLNRLPPPFPGPPGLPMLNPGSGPNAPLSHIPIPDSSTVRSTPPNDFKHNFGLTPPLLFPGNPNINLDLSANANMNLIPPLNNSDSRSNSDSNLEDNNNQIFQKAFQDLLPFTKLPDKENKIEDPDYRTSDGDSNKLGDGSKSNDNASSSAIENRNKTNTHPNSDNDLNYSRENNAGELDRSRGYRFYERDNNRNFGGDRNHRFRRERSPPSFRDEGYDGDRFRRSDRDSYQRNRFEGREFGRGRDFRGGRFGREGPPPGRWRDRSPDRDRDRYRDNRRDFAEDRSRRFDKRGRSRERSSEDSRYNAKKSRWTDRSHENRETKDENWDDPQTEIKLVNDTEWKPVDVPPAEENSDEPPTAETKSTPEVWDTITIPPAPTIREPLPDTNESPTFVPLLPNEDEENQHQPCLEAAENWDKLASKNEENWDLAESNENEVSNENDVSEKPEENSEKEIIEDNINDSWAEPKEDIDHGVEESTNDFWVEQRENVNFGNEENANDSWVEQRENVIHEFENSEKESKLIDIPEEREIPPPEKVVDDSNDMFSDNWVDPNQLKGIDTSTDAE